MGYRFKYVLVETSELCTFHDTKPPPKLKSAPPNKATKSPPLKNEAVENKPTMAITAEQALAAIKTEPTVEKNEFSGKGGITASRALRAAREEYMR